MRMNRIKRWILRRLFHIMSPSKKTRNEWYGYTRSQRRKNKKVADRLLDDIRKGEGLPAIINEEEIEIEPGLIIERRS